MRIISNEELHIVSGGEGGDEYLAFPGRDRLNPWGNGGGPIGQIDFLLPAALVPAAAAAWGGAYAGIQYVRGTDKPTVEGLAVAVTSGAVGAVIATFGIVGVIYGGAVATGGSIAATELFSGKK